MKKITALLIPVILLSACRENNPPPPPPPTSYDVITTGVLIDINTPSIKPGYWVGKEWHALQADNTQQAFPYGLTRHAQSLIIAGGYEGEHPQTGNNILLPCIWRNGLMIKLPVSELSVTDRCSASDVVWYNDALYVLGDADLEPVIWKIDGEQYSIIPLPKNQHVTGRRKGSNLIIWNDRLCFAGNEQKQTGDGLTYSAGYWSVGHDDHPSFTTIQDNLGYALCFAIAARQDKLVITGEYGETGQNILPALWTGTGLHLLSQQLQPNTQRTNEVMIDAKENIWLNILDIQPQYKPLLWKARLSGTKELISPDIPAQATGFCHNLATCDDQIAYAYTYMHEGKRHACVKSNTGTDTLDLKNQSDVTLYRTAIFPR